MVNQNLELIARENIDQHLKACGWLVQNKKHINLHVGVGVAVREYFTDISPVDNVLFVEGKPCGFIEAKRKVEGHRTNFHEDQGEDYAKAKLEISFKLNSPRALIQMATVAGKTFTAITDVYSLLKYGKTIN